MTSMESYRRYAEDNYGQEVTSIEKITVAELVEKLKQMPQDSIVIFQKPKNANGWCNKGLIISKGDVHYVAGYGTIIK